jgi:hypothetical protein
LYGTGAKNDDWFWERPRAGHRQND